MNNTLILMQGSSASGKSFVAEALQAVYELRKIECQIASTDNFWYINSDGVKYEFDRNKLGEAHAWNQNYVAEMMEHDVNVIIVDNTNTTKKEAAPYIQLAKKYGYEIRVISVSCSDSVAKMYNSQRAINRRVPENVIESQNKRIERISLD
ncbi:MAG: ATP-binding protein [Brevinematales bacterium]